MPPFPRPNPAHTACERALRDLEGARDAIAALATLLAAHGQRRVAGEIRRRVDGLLDRLAELAEHIPPALPGVVYPPPQPVRGRTALYVPGSTETVHLDCTEAHVRQANGAIRVVIAIASERGHPIAYAQGPDLASARRDLRQKVLLGLRLQQDFQAGLIPAPDGLPSRRETTLRRG